MQDAVDDTNKALIWFFAAYVLLVGVLFSNLFVGILINMFQFGERMSRTTGGLVRLATDSLCIDLSSRKKEQLLKDLGSLGQKIHFPTEMFHQSLVEKHAKEIDAAGGRLYPWAALVMAKAFRGLLAKRSLHIIEEYEQNLPPGLSKDKIISAFRQAYDELGLTTASVISTSESQHSVIINVCKALQLDDDHISHMMHVLVKRKKDYLRLFEQRKLPNKVARAYNGLPNPRKVPLTWIMMLRLFHELVAATSFGAQGMGMQAPPGDTVNSTAALPSLEANDSAPGVPISRPGSPRVAKNKLNLVVSPLTNSDRTSNSTVDNPNQI
jgi:hypothetical protein